VTTTFFLVRHAAHDNVGGFLAGRSTGIRLGEGGKAQAKHLGARMARESFSAIYSSPRERTQETAKAIADASGLDTVETADELDEIDFGPWSGKTFEELDRDDTWRRWNSVRALARTPGGETMLDVQTRILRLIERLGLRHTDGRLVLVSHADVNKTAVIHVLGMPLDAWQRFEISPASITTIIIGDWGAKVLSLNEVVV
jgi:broad specificity phosphatase PhoE